MIKGAGKVHPTTGHEGLSVTSTLDGVVGGQGHDPAALPPGKKPGNPFYWKLAGPQGRS